MSIERYGKLGAAMTANVITYRGRSAAREIGKVLGFDRGDAGPSFAGWWRMGISGCERHAGAAIPRCRT